MIDETHERRALRRLMRRRRRALAPADVRAAGHALSRNLATFSRFRLARNVAAYLAVDNEIPLDEVIRTAWSRNIPVYLPCLRGDHMEFRRYAADTSLISNRFGIAEPASRPSTRINPRFLDVVLAPLLAFDNRGARLGTGGGYYDRTFAFLTERKHWKRPLFFGVAYAFQQVEFLAEEAWDVPLDGVVTNTGIHLFDSVRRTF